MDRHVSMTLLKSTVLSNVMQIVTTNYNGSLHFQFLHNSCQNTSTDSNITSEWTFLVNVGAIDSLSKSERKKNEINFIEITRANLSNVNKEYISWIRAPSPELIYNPT